MPLIMLGKYSGWTSLDRRTSGFLKPATENNSEITAKTASRNSKSQAIVKSLTVEPRFTVNIITSRAIFGPPKVYLHCFRQITFEHMKNFTICGIGAVRRSGRPRSLSWGRADPLPEEAFFLTRSATRRHAAC
jgi:hypothetical protein